MKAGTYEAFEERSKHILTRRLEMYNLTQMMMMIDFHCGGVEAELRSDPLVAVECCTNIIGVLVSTVPKESGWLVPHATRGQPA